MPNAEISGSKPRGFGLRVAALVSLVLCSACTSPETSTPSVEVRDSAGIRIVEDLSTQDPRSPWRVPVEPLFRVGWDDAGPLLEDISAGAVLADGRVVVAEQDGSAIHFLGRDGGYERGVGGKGEGPGEYQKVLSLVRMPGDSVLVQDDRNVRGTVLGPEGELVREFRLIPQEGYFINRTLGVSAVGDILLWPWGYAVSAVQEPGWVDGFLLRMSPDGVVQDTVFSGGFVDQRGTETRDPFGDFGGGDVGSGVFVFARSDKGEVTWIDGSGSVLQFSRWAPTWRRAEESVWQSYADAYRARIGPDGDQERAERNLAERRGAASESLPLFSFFFADIQGNAWLGEYGILGTPPSRYMVILRDGTRLGWVEVPEGLRILDIGEDRILGVEEDQWDVQAVSVYRIEKG